MAARELHDGASVMAVNISAVAALPWRSTDTYGNDMVVRKSSLQCVMTADGGAVTVLWNAMECRGLLYLLWQIHEHSIAAP